MIDLSLLEPVKFERAAKPAILDSSTASGRKTLLMPVGCSMVGSTLVVAETQYELNLDDSSLWDDVQYATPANRAGRNFYKYDLSTGSILLSANSTVPNGYTAENSRKVGGFHCLCANVGTISGHPLSGFVAGDILPAGIWDLWHRPLNPENMVYSSDADLWVGIYLWPNYFGATIKNTTNWMDFVDLLAAVGQRMLFDAEFQIVAGGSNEETNIAGSANPVTTGGHTDTAGRRMISNIGCEDCCGVYWQWLGDQSFRVDGLPDTGDPTWSYYDLPGSKGSLYRQGTNGDVKLRAGGGWSDGSNCGSRARFASSMRWFSYSYIGCRGCAASQGA